jgi:2-dehydropantoate 2-reductase
VTDLVVGHGAVGRLIAGTLAAGGREVAMVRRAKPDGPAAADVTVVDAAGNRHATSVTEIARPIDLPAAPELIVLAVKMFDLAEATASCAGWPSATCLTVSNGVGAEELVSGLRPGAGLIAGSVTTSVETAGDRTVTRLSRGGIGLAPVQGDVDSLIGSLVTAFSSGGLRSARFDDSAAMKWSKLVANLVGNATSAIVDQSPAALYSNAAVFAIERRQLLEALAVMRRLGLAPVALPGADVRLLAAGTRLPPGIGRPILRKAVAMGRGGKDPSLRIHARSGSGPSEVDWLNGAVADTAERLGGAAPVNRQLTILVHEVLEDPSRRDWFSGRPDRLVAEFDGRT